MSERVQVTRSIVGLFAMQVCAAADATDEEILRVCNWKNPSGTESGWAHVVRAEENGFLKPKPNAPIACADDPTRTHFLVFC